MLEAVELDDVLVDVEPAEEPDDESDPDDVLEVVDVDVEDDEDDESEPADELELEPPRLSVL